jgi:hypothetical protein
MNEKPNGNERPFPGLRVPEPPEDLRRQVMSRARQALEIGPRQDLWARIWESRQARLAWGASVLVLAVCHLVVPVGDAGPAREPSTLARTGSDDHEELADIVDLPRLSLEARPIAASTRTPGETEADLDTAAPPAVSEENAS